MEWKNIGYDVYKEIKGEEDFDRKMKDADKVPSASIFDAVNLSLEKEKIKFLFGAAALYTGKRPTHPIGVGAQGIATIVTEPQFPACEFFTPGRSFPVCLRHSTLKSIDDAMLDFLSASIRFADSDEESLLDIPMSTGRSNPLSNVQAIYDALRANQSGKIKDFYLESPDRLASNIDGLRRAPDSFSDQRYYSEIILDFKAFDDVKRYVRFRLIPADGTLETGLLSEDDQRKPWEYARLPSETRPKDYLKKEFKERISRGPIRYKLQLTLHETRSDDPPGILNIARYWDEATHLWLDVADVTLTTLLTPDVIDGFRFNAGTLPNCLCFLPARTIYDSNCIPHIRKEVYARTQKIRSLRRSSQAPDHLATYIISVETGAQRKAGTNANISVSLTGTKGKTKKLAIGFCFANDFEAGQTDEFTVQGMDVGEVLMIHLYNDRAGLWSDWFVNKITVTSSKQEKTFVFPCYRWVVSDMVVFEGKALLPFQDQPEAIRNQRILELQQRQEHYRWGQLPPGVTDLPGFIHAVDKHGDLPKDAQFSDESSRSFLHGSLRGAVNLGLFYLFTLFDSWDNLDSFKKIFTGWAGDVPQISHNDLWMEDRMFGYQFLNGCNPCVIERCNELPSNFPVTNEMVKNSLDRGMSLEEEIKAGHIYIVDYQELEGIKRSGEDGNSKLYYAAEPLCLFYVKSSGDMVPIAIQLLQQPSDSNPIWTPDDSQYDWLLAKMWFRNADHQFHQMGTHLTKTHLVMEAFAVAVWRQLPSIHPVFQLLFPHLRSTMAINTIGRKELIAKGGIVDKTLSIGGGGHIQFLEKTYKNFKFDMLSLPHMMKKKGVDDAEKLPNYYYRDDGLRMWTAISNFIQEFIALFYQSDSDVSRDTELQSWVLDIHDNGFPVRPGDVDHEFPTCLQSRDELVHLLTCIVFGCSCQHAAVNFSQMDFTAFIPNVPPVMRLPPPTRKNQATLKSIMDTLPDKSQAGWHIATMYTLTRLSEDERFIGDYSQSPLTGREVESAISRFQSALQKISEEIKERNASVEFPYPYLLPERVPNSIAI